VERRLTDLPLAGHSTQLRVRVPRYRCSRAGCDREVFAADTSTVARPGWTTTRRCAGTSCAVSRSTGMTVAAIARELGRSWDTVNHIAVAATRTLVAGDTTRLDGVRVIGVDEHRSAHTRHAAGDGFVTVPAPRTARRA
jgi:transposase